MSKYDEGVEAAKNGEEFYMNPYSAADNEKKNFHDWFAGVGCYGRKMITQDARV
jgi:hypothetical protein